MAGCRPAPVPDAHRRTTPAPELCSRAGAGAIGIRTGAVRSETLPARPDACQSTPSARRRRIRHESVDRPRRACGCHARRSASQAVFTSWSTGVDGERMARSHFRLIGLYCAACAGMIEGALRAEPGVLDASVSYATRTRHGGLGPGARRGSRAGRGDQPGGLWRRTRPGRPGARVAPARAARRRCGACSSPVLHDAGDDVRGARVRGRARQISADLLRLLQWAAWLLSLPVLLFSAAPIFR